MFLKSLLFKWDRSGVGIMNAVLAGINGASGGHEGVLKIFSGSRRPERGRFASLRKRLRLTDPIIGFPKTNNNRKSKCVVLYDL
jgi:hypothetical protein